MTMNDRSEWMGLAARSDPGMLARLLGELPTHQLARAPQTGAVMVRGRAGGTGAPFNLGEMTVTRCSVTLTGGAVGHAYVQGRDKSHATRAAILDALMQGERAEAIRRDVLAPLARHAAERAATRRAKAAATKVEFFTMVRGED